MRYLLEMYDIILSKPHLLTQKFDGNDILFLIELGLINDINIQGHGDLSTIMADHKKSPFIFNCLVDLMNDQEVGAMIEFVERFKLKKKNEKKDGGNEKKDGGNEKKEGNRPIIVYLIDQPGNGGRMTSRNDVITIVDEEVIVEEYEKNGRRRKESKKTETISLV